MSRLDSGLNHGAHPQLRRPDWRTAYDYCFASPTALPVEEVEVDRAIGRILARDLAALSDVPHYDSSAMDGWAVSGSGPWTLVDGSTLAAGEAKPIATGGLIPAGTSGVLRSEHGVEEQHGPRRVVRRSGAAAGEPRPGQHIRHAGEEAKKADVVVAAGSRLNPAHCAIAAVCGHDSLPVLGRPRVRIIVTGDEVVAMGVPQPGYVRDAFGPLAMMVDAFGGTAVSHERVGDDLDALTAAISTDSATSDVILTTGGTGASRADLLRMALARVGAGILIDGVAMRPGGPSLVADLGGNRFLAGLPGNPLAAMMGMLTLVRPLLAGIQGTAVPVVDSVIAGDDVPEGRGGSLLLPYRDVDGAAVPVRWLGSAMLRGLAEADGVMVSPASGSRRGDRVVSLPLPW